MKIYENKYVEPSQVGHAVVKMKKLKVAKLSGVPAPSSRVDLLLVSLVSTPPAAH